MKRKEINILLSTSFINDETHPNIDKLFDILEANQNIFFNFEIISDPKRLMTNPITNYIREKIYYSESNNIGYNKFIDLPAEINFDYMILINSIEDEVLFNTIADQIDLKTKIICFNGFKNDNHNNILLSKGAHTIEYFKNKIKGDNNE